MILYRQNPNLKLKTVRRVNGDLEYLRNCRKIKDKYYLVDEDCFLIEGKWYSKNSKLVTTDHETGKFVVINKTPLTYGIIGINSDGSERMGYFTENKYKNVWAHTGQFRDVRALNTEILLKGNFIESLGKGVWHFKGSLNKEQIARMNRIDEKKVWTNKGYNIEDNVDEFKEKMAMYAKAPIKVTANAVKYGKFLGDITFGSEIETGSGFIPDHIQYQTGVVICRDGSIDNAEYVTVPYSGPKGLCTLDLLAKYMSERTSINIKCAFHIHLGTLPTDRLFIVSLYALSIKIQEELFKMFPYYKTEPEGIKAKNYTKKTRKLGIGMYDKSMTKAQFTEYIDDSYYRIATFLNDGNNPGPDFNRRNNNHRQRNKWERVQRYYWLNFMNMFFSPRRTMEFRLHQATTNGQKMINWLFMCNAIVKYAEANALAILGSAENIPLKNVLNYYADTFKTKDAKFLSAYLNAYVKDRTQYFQKDWARKDYQSFAEQDEDKSYEFVYEGVKKLV